MEAFLLKKLITYWILLPPGNIILLLLIVALYLFFTDRKGTAKFLTFLAVVLYALSIKPVAVYLISPLEHQYKVPSKEERDSCDVIALLGGGVKPDAPFLDLKNDLTEDTTKRAAATLKLYEEKPRYIIASGYSVFDNISEAQVMKNWLTYFGVNPDYIITENRARDTFENAEYIKKIFDLNAFQKVCIVTSAYHMPRTVLLFKRVGFENFQMLPVPVDFKSEKINWNVYDFLPRSYWLNISTKAIKEYVGLFYYKMAY
ncbi:MAG: YdcF family protein [Aquificota bacterium]